MIIRRSLAVIGSLVLLLPMVAAWQHPSVPWSLRWLSAALLVTGAISPLAGLCGLIVALPLATPWELFSGATLPSGAEAAEMMLLPFLGGTCLRLAFDRVPVRSRLAAPAAVLGAALFASCVCRMFILQVATAFPDDFVRALWRHVTMHYFTDPQSYSALHVTADWLEALVLAVTAERIMRRHPSAHLAAVGLLIVGGVETSALAVNRFFQVVGRNGGTVAFAMSYIRSRPRFNPQWLDLNAAGSYYALALPPAIWLAIRRRWWVFVTLPPLLLALWFTGSRSALASVVIGLLIGWIVTRPKVSWPRVLGVVGAAAVLTFYAAWTGGDFQMPAESALAYRKEFASIAFRMTRDYPWFGVGITEFKHRSIAYLAEDGLTLFGPRGGENAHNNFLQVLAELGLTGFLPFLWLLGRPLADLFQAARPRAATLPIVALASGVAAFLISSLGGHPFLTAQVLFAFFLVFGVFSGVTPPRPSSPSGTRMAAWIAAAAVAFLAVSLPFRVLDTRRSLTLSRVFFGASELHDSIDGLTYRLADPRSAWYVPSSAHSIDIPLRWLEPAASCSVTIRVDGRVVNHVSPRADQWLHTRFDLSDIVTRNASRRFDLEVQGQGCTLMVGPLVTHD